MTSGDAFPCLPGPYLVNYTGGDIELTGKRKPRAVAFRVLADKPHVLLCNQGARVLLADWACVVLYLVRHVLLMSRPSKIASSTVRSISVAVCNLVQRARPVAKKADSDKNVNILSDHLSVKIDADMRVASVKPGPQYAPGPNACPASRSFDLAPIANGVVRRKRDGFPDFFSHAALYRDMATEGNL